MIKQIAMIGLLAFVLSACSSEGEPVKASKGLDPVIVSEVEGCRLYRVHDGRNVYFTVCNSQVRSTTSWSQDCGKNCKRPVSVDTNYREENGN